jgi:hypothetical protein
LSGVPPTAVQHDDVRATGQMIRVCIAPNKNKKTLTLSKELMFFPNDVRKKWRFSELFVSFGPFTYEGKNTGWCFCLNTR